ncbi:TPA: DNA primase, partial [Yersinia enterocolitica]
ATGQAAAFNCAMGNLRAKNDLISVSIRWPENDANGNCDFNDLITDGAVVYEQIYAKRAA